MKKRKAHKKPLKKSKDTDVKQTKAPLKPLKNTDVKQSKAPLKPLKDTELKQKKCSCCKKELPTSFFSSDKSRKDGLNSQCKPCKALMGREYRAIKDIMNRWGESKGNSWIWKLDLRHITERCEYCDIEINIGHLVWYKGSSEYHDKGKYGYSCICRKCLIKKDKVGSDLKEIVLAFDYEYTEKFREQLAETDKISKMPAEEANKAMKKKKTWINIEKFKEFQEELSKN